MSENSSPSWFDVARGLADAANDLATSAQLAGSPLLGQLRSEVTRQISEPRHQAEQMTTALDRVEVRATGRRVSIIGDPSVANLHVEGPHSTTRDGRIVEIVADGELPGKDALALLGPALGLRSLDALDTLKRLGMGRELVVRVNPDLAVDIEVTGGSLVVTGMPTLAHVRVTGGTATLTGVEGIGRALFQAGQVTLTGSFNGSTRIRSESGQLTLTLDEEADVEAQGRSQLARISWPDGISVDAYRVGKGLGRLQLDLVMGQATINRHVPSSDEASEDADLDES